MNNVIAGVCQILDMEVSTEISTKVCMHDFRQVSLRKHVNVIQPPMAVETYSFTARLYIHSI